MDQLIHNLLLQACSQLSTKVFAKVEGTSKTDNGYMLEVEDYGSVDPSQVVRFKN